MTDAICNLPTTTVLKGVNATSTIGVVQMARDKNLPPIKGPARWLLVVLASYANDRKGSTCWPSHKELAEVCGVSVRAVQNSLVILEAHGLITIKAQTTGDRGRATNLYTINTPSAVTPEKPEPAKDRSLEGMLNDGSWMV